jgi:hypothetical protein
MYTAATLAAVVLLAGCGGDDATGTPSTVQLLDVSVTLPAGVNCDEGGTHAEFTGTTGKTVTILASGATNLHPVFVLYGPDFTTQLGSSSAYGDGKARLSIALTQSGTHNLSICETNGLAGTLRITVVAPNL